MPAGSPGRTPSRSSTARSSKNAATASPRRANARGRGRATSMPRPPARGAWSMLSAIVLATVLRAARALPRHGYARVFEPAFEDFRAGTPAPGSLVLGAVAILADSFRVICIAALTESAPSRSPEPDGAAFMDTLLQDVRYAGRMLVKNPAFSVVAALALALGIGANAAIFSLIYSLFVRPLPYARADELIRLWGQSPDGRLARLGASVPKFDHLRRSQRSFVALAGDSATAMALTSLRDETRWE